MFLRNKKNEHEKRTGNDKWKISQVISLFVFIFLCLIGTNILVWYAVYVEDQHGLLSVAFLDVGEGSAIFIRVPGGNQILIDGGPDSNILRQLSRVMPFYDRSIDLVLISDAGDTGRIGGLISVLSFYRVGLITGPSPIDTSLSTSAIGRGLIETIHNKKVPEVSAERGTVFQIAPDVSLIVLFPDRDLSEAKNLAENSIVAKLIYKNTSLLITGDAPQNIQAYLNEIDGDSESGDISKNNIPKNNLLKSDILAVGHYGSASSTLSDFVSAVAPSFAVISVAAGNRYAYPAQKILDLLKNVVSVHTKVLTTSGKGIVLFQSDGDKWLEKRL
jgi:competence protein ComEC